VKKRGNVVEVTQIVRLTLKVPTADLVAFHEWCFASEIFGEGGGSSGPDLSRKGSNSYSVGYYSVRHAVAIQRWWRRRMAS
jgi:hypothetical protein